MRARHASDSSWTWAWHTVLPPWKFDEVMSCSSLTQSCSACLCCVTLVDLSPEVGQEPTDGSDLDTESSSCVFMSRTDRAPRAWSGNQSSGDRGPLFYCPKQYRPPTCRKDGGKQRRGRKKEKGRGIRRLLRLDLPVLLLLQGGER